MSAERTKYTLYSAELYHNTGSGTIHKTLKNADFGNDPERIQNEINRIRMEQKLINLKYKNGKSGIMIAQPQKGIIHDNDVELILDKATASSTAMIGSSKSGKSTLAMYLYDKYYNTKKYISVLFCLNPQITVYKGYKDLIVSRGFDEKSTKLIKGMQYINTQCNNKYKFVVMMDDIIGAKYDRIVNELVLTYRNSNISSIFSLQYPKLLSPSNRANINNIFIFHFNTDECANSAIDLYLKDQFFKLGYKDKDSRLRFFREMTKDHGFIYVNPLHNTISFHRLSLISK